MDEIDRRIEEKQRQLAEVLEPSFAAAEDADLAATMLVMALDHPVEGEDHSSYLAALERLPKGSTANPRVLLVSPYEEGADRLWRVAFIAGHGGHKSSRRFPTEAQANDYATDFLVRLKGEINRP